MRQESAAGVSAMSTKESAKKLPKGAPERTMTEQEFLADPRKAARTARSDGPVMIEANHGKARVFIVGQRERLELD